MRYQERHFLDGPCRSDVRLASEDSWTSGMMIGSIGLNMPWAYILVGIFVLNPNHSWVSRSVLCIAVLHYFSSIHHCVDFLIKLLKSVWSNCHVVDSYPSILLWLYISCIMGIQSVNLEFWRIVQLQKQHFCSYFSDWTFMSAVQLQ